MSDQPRSGIPPIWIGIALVASLVVNTFFIGLMVGGKLTSERWVDGVRDRFGAEAGMEGFGRHGMPPDLDPRALARMLPESARDEARAMTEARGPEIRDLFMASMEARGAALDAMRAEPFDRDALATALATSREADEAARAAVHELTVDIIAGMSSEEREQIGMELYERFPGRHDRHDWRERHHERHFDRDGRRPPPPSGDED